MKKRISKFAVAFIFATLLVSCYPGDDVSVKDMDTTSTFYKDLDFDTPPQSAMIFWDVTQLKGEDGDNIDYNGEIDSEILNTTLDNLVNLYGVDNVYIFTLNDVPLPIPSNSNVKIIKKNETVPNVDATIVPSIILRKKESVGIIYPPCMPGWWYWYCYPPIVGVSSYGMGTVVLTMNIDNNSKPSWTALMRGLLSSSINSERAISGIDRAFEQSPYLN